MIDKIHAGAEEVKKRRGRPPKQKRSVIQINNKKIWE